MRETSRHFAVAVIQSGGLPERLRALKVGAIVTGDTALEAEKLGFHKLIDLSQLPIQSPSSAIIVRRSFLTAKRDTVKRFLRGRIEDIKIAKTDKERTVFVMRKLLKAADRSVLETSSKLIKPSMRKFPRPMPN